MKSDDDLLAELVEAVAEREVVPWRRAVSRAPERDRGVIRALAALARISDAHASVPDEDELQTGGEPPADDRDSLEGGQWGSLSVLGRIGVGAYGEVYRARDNLDREVALKLVRGRRGRLRLDSGELVEEGRLLARIKHRNVVTVYGADYRDGMVGIWMELIRGQNLHEIVAQSGALGAREAARIGIDLCRALAAVHGQGIVHRDVKAQNVMREEGGRIVLMDLGIGREVPSDDSFDTSLAGTPAYIAPELLEGRHATPQSDVYALGVLLFHLVTGSFPVRCESPSELVAAHREGRTRLLRDLRPALDDRFIRIVERALDPDPDRRFATAGRFERALRSAQGAPAARTRLRTGLRVAVGLGGLALLAGLLSWPFWSLGPADDGEPRRVVVEDPVNHTDQVLFDRPLRDLLRLALDDSPDLAVLPRARINEILPQIGIEAAATVDHAAASALARHVRDVALLITTEVDTTPEGQRVTATVRDPADRVVGTSVVLIPCGTGTPEIDDDSASCAVDGNDFVARIDDLTSTLRAQLGETQVVINRTPLAQATTRDVVALRRYSEAEEIMARGGAVEDAIALLETAVERDPEFPMAWSRLALYLVGISRYDAALDAANRAQQLADRVPETERLIIAGTVAVANWRYREAIQEFEKARMLGSDDRALLRQLPQAYGFVLGDTAKAVELAAEVAEAYPSEPLDQGLLALFYAMDARTGDARDVLRDARRRFPDFAYFDWPEGIAHLVDGDLAGAERTFARLASAGGVLASFGRRYRAQTLAVGGRVREAIRELERGIPIDVAGDYSGNDADNLRFLAMLHLLDGAPEEATYHLRRLAALLQDQVTSVRPMRHAALLAIEAGEPALAADLLERLTAIDRQHPSDLSRAAVAQVRGLLDLGDDPTSARSDLDDAWRLWPDPLTLLTQGTYWIEQATTAATAGDDRTARAAYERAQRHLEELRSLKGWTMHRYFGLPWVLTLPALAHCHAQLGQLEAAAATYDEFLALWGDADAGLDVLVRARSERAAVAAEAGADPG